MTAPTCIRPTCTRRRWAKGKLCEQHHGAERAAGLRGRIPIGPTYEHVKRLREIGWTISEIAFAAGLPTSTVYVIARGTRKLVLVPTANRIGAIELNAPRPLVHERTVTESCGFQRRVQALAWMGWRVTDLGPLLGVRPEKISNSIWKKRVSRALEQRLAELYERLSVQPGPSPMIARRARTLGYAPPLAWDDIDDPKEVPNAGEKTSGVDYGEADFLRAFGMSDELIAKRLGIAVRTLREKKVA